MVGLLKNHYFAILNPTIMKQFLPLLLALMLSLFFSCSTKRQVGKSVNTGNYNRAIDDAVNKLRVNKDAKRNQDIILLLEDAYAKANARDINKIARLKTSNNPEFLISIYENYIDLERRQQLIKPLLPLYVNGRKAKFHFKNYNSNIQVSKENLSDHLYENAIALLENDDKVTIREAYADLKYLERINPNYETTRALLEEAHERGIAHVLVSIDNNTEQVIPSDLEDAILDFNTYGLNQFWTIYHNENTTQKNFDFAMNLQLQQIILSPEQAKEREILRERRVKDGWEYQLDSNGNVKKDSLGNDVKLDKFVNTEARILEVQQFKSSEIFAQVVLINLKNNTLVEKFPIESGFVFENFYATFRGDRKALTDEDITLIQGAPVPFPPNEQMIFDSGENLKLQLRNIIAQVRL